MEENVFQLLVEQNVSHPLSLHPGMRKVEDNVFQLLSLHPGMRKVKENVFQILVEENVLQLRVEQTVSHPLSLHPGMRKIEDLVFQLLSLHPVICEKWRTMCFSFSACTLVCDT